MHIFRINMMIDVEKMMWKIDTNGVKDLVLKSDAITTYLDRDIGVLLVCREDWHKFKQFDHWTRKGLACYSVIIPYEKALSDETSKEALTKICADLVVECLLLWAEKKRKKAAKAQAKAA
jgi:hypothetical protein